MVSGSELALVGLNVIVKVPIKRNARRIATGTVFVFILGQTILIFG